MQMKMRVIRKKSMRMRVIFNYPERQTPKSAEIRLEITKMTRPDSLKVGDGASFCGEHPL
jgi:ribosomal protein S24E